MTAVFFSREPRSMPTASAEGRAPIWRAREGASAASRPFRCHGWTAPRRSPSACSGKKDRGRASPSDDSAAAAADDFPGWFFYFYYQMSVDPMTSSAVLGDGHEAATGSEAAGPFFFFGARRRRTPRAGDESKRAVGEPWASAENGPSSRSVPGPSAFAVGLPRGSREKQRPTLQWQTTGVRRRVARRRRRSRKMSSCKSTTRTMGGSNRSESRSARPAATARCTYLGCISGCIQVIFRVFRLYSGYISALFRLYLGYTQVIFKLYSGYIYGHRTMEKYNMLVMTPGTMDC